MSHSANIEERKRTYKSSLRREQAEETKTRIARAARRLFVERGWAGTRVRDVAREAGVAEPTVYAAYGSKAGLALALVDAVDEAGDRAATYAAFEAAGGEPAGELAALIGFVRRLFEGEADVIALLREGGRSEPDLRAAHEEGRSRADRAFRRFSAGWGIDVDAGADTFAALCNVDVWRVLTEERGWSADQVEAWWCAALTRLLPPVAD